MTNLNDLHKFEYSIFLESNKSEVGFYVNMIDNTKRKLIYNYSLDYETLYFASFILNELVIIQTQEETNTIIYLVVEYNIIDYDFVGISSKQSEWLPPNSFILSVFIFLNP